MIKKPEFQIACKDGCDYCCRSLEIQVSFPYEIKRLWTEAKHVFSHHALKELKRTIHEQFNAVKQMDDPITGIWATHLPCPFLKDHACSVYDARPVACRSYVSVNLQDCKSLYDGKCPSMLPEEKEYIDAAQNEGDIELIKKGHAPYKKPLDLRIAFGDYFGWHSK